MVQGKSYVVVDRPGMRYRHPSRGICIYWQVVDPRVENMVVRQYLTAAVGLLGGDRRGCGVQAGGGVDGAQAAGRHRPGDRHIGSKLEGGAGVDRGWRRWRDDHLSGGGYAAKEREEKRQLNP